MMKKNTDDLALLKQGYYDPEDAQAEYDPEEAMLIDVFGDYYLDGRYKGDGMTREDLLEDVYYNGYDEYGNYIPDKYAYPDRENWFDEESGDHLTYGCGGYDVYNCLSDSYGYGHYYGGYGAGYGCCSNAYSSGGYIDIEDYEPSMGKVAPAHSIAKPVDIKEQRGPKCSAYAASCLLRYFGTKVYAKNLYPKFLKLFDGSAIPSSVGRVIGAKLHTHGMISDIEHLIDEGKPVLILGHYDKTAEWDNLHYMLVTGYDEDNIYLADSLHQTGLRYYNRKVDRKTFKKMWNTSRTLAVRIFYGRNVYYTYNGGDQT